MLLVMFIAWVVWLFPETNHSSPAHLFFNPMVGLCFGGFGAIVAFLSLRQISHSSVLGKTLLGVGLAIVLYGIGDMVWGYYAFFSGREIPYPSWSDVFYIAYYPAIIYACVGLLSAARGLVKWTHIAEGCILGLISAIVILGYIIRPDASAGWNSLHTIFDFAYPLGDIILLTFSYICLRSLGGTLKKSTLILVIAMIIEAVADIVFTLTTENGTYYNASLVDLLFVLNIYLLTLVVIMNMRAGMRKLND